MPNKNYQSGRNFEYRVKKYLEEKGYYVMRSAGSKSPFDLVAVPTDKPNLCQTLLVQCKHGTKISKQERDKIQALGISLTGMVICTVAWSKARGQIEFHWWKLSEWKKLDGI